MQALGRAAGERRRSESPILDPQSTAIGQLEFRLPLDGLARL